LPYEPWKDAPVMHEVDFIMANHNLWPGQTAGYVDHGLVDENRQRRPSYYGFSAWVLGAEDPAVWDVLPTAAR
jgi:hypothetical protein